MLNFSMEFDLSELSNLFSDSKEVDRVVYEPVKNPNAHWLQSWFYSPTTNEIYYVAFYRSGSCIIVGTSSEEEFDEMADVVTEVMRPAIGDNEPIRSIKNVVATAELGEPIDLNTLALLLGLSEVEYEPEQFPALVYKEDDCVFLVFNSGKIVCTGLSGTSRVDKTVNSFLDEIKELLTVNP